MTLLSTLFTIRNFEFQYRHLLVIGILIIAFSVSFMIRSQSADYGFELNEFDPFFNFRATEFIVENGFSEYFDWNDDLSWYPHGRDVSATSQVMLHTTAAITYQIFGGDSSLYDFTILFPVVFASLTTIVIFALVRVMGGTTAGLFAALFYSISIPLIIRGSIGWFKSEPLGLFYGLLGLYLFLSGIKSENKKIVISKVIGGGIILGFGLASWGGIQFFIIPIGIFILILPFIRKDHHFIIWVIPLFVTSLLLTSMMFERPGISFVLGMGGLSLIIPTGFFVSCIIIQKIKQEHQTRNGLILLFGIILAGSFLITVNEESKFLPLPSFRYLNAINPFLTTTIPLVDSVSEHATTTLEQSFFFHSVLMIFSGIGIWLIIKNIQNKNSNFIKNDMLFFSLILGIIGVYVSSTFVRLEVFGSIAVIVLASLGLTALTKEFFKNKPQGKKPTGKLIKLPYVAGIIILLIIPMIFPVDANTPSMSKSPPTILNGGSIYQITSNDWLDSMEWIKNNTSEDAVIAAWWDYGYWIQTMGERATLADNSTVHTRIIENIAKMFFKNPDDAWISLNEMQADYILVFVAGEKLGGIDSEKSFYHLRGGGDESKKQWFMRIAGEDLSKYLFSDGVSSTDYFRDNTLLGKMFPFTPVSYVNFQTAKESPTYQPGFIPIFEKEIKYPSDGNGPLRLVYASSSFTEEKVGAMLGVFIYEINKNYVSISDKS
ncbi:glycosyltransferase family 39 protein [Marine Group I thaumarchaeote]|uniref:dolichyl-phosphooligosaccharide-protein glycotransferase n=1 Tax=Marine Group I thaumarchaeote TaxID=2511932 RepID=A0A7K4P2C9_9ARCH|nr:glycosyltransferase family 39 protein [Marine Group I thaumarchaeote]